MNTLLGLLHSVDGDYGSGVFLANSVRRLMGIRGGQGVVVVRESYNGDAVTIAATHDNTATLLFITYLLVGRLVGSVRQVERVRDTVIISKLSQGKIEHLSN